MKANPTFIFLDLNLAGSDGIEALRYLSNEGCKCPIVIISGHEEEIRQSSLRLGQTYNLKMQDNLQ